MVLLASRRNVGVDTTPFQSGDIRRTEVAVVERCRRGRAHCGRDGSDGRRHLRLIIGMIGERVAADQERRLVNRHLRVVRNGGKIT